MSTRRRETVHHGLVESPGNGGRVEAGLFRDGGKTGKIVGFVDVKKLLVASCHR